MRMTMIEKARDDENDDDRNVLTDSVIDHCCTNILSLTCHHKFVSLRAVCDWSQ